MPEYHFISEFCQCNNSPGYHAPHRGLCGPLYSSHRMHEAIGTSTGSAFDVMRPVTRSIWKAMPLLTGNTRTRIPPP